MQRRPGKTLRPHSPETAMIQIALLLFGADFVRRQAGILAWLGTGWAALGIFILIDGLDGVRYFPVHIFGAFLLLESLVTLSVASGGVGAQRAVLYFKGGVFRERKRV